MTTPQPIAIIGAIDSSDQAQLVLEYVGNEAARHEAADVHLLRVIDLPPKYADRVPIEDERKALLADVQPVLEPFARAAPPWRLHIHVRVGRPEEEIVALAHEARADVIVIGHHGEGGRRHSFAGNTVERVLRLAPCAVLVAQDRLYEAEPAEQCADCVRVRAESGGEDWFCQAHHAESLPLHDVVPFESLALHSVGFGSGGVF